MNAQASLDDAVRMDWLAWSIFRKAAACVASLGMHRLAWVRLWECTGLPGKVMGIHQLARSVCPECMWFCIAGKVLLGPVVAVRALDLQSDPNCLFFFGEID